MQLLARVFLVLMFALVSLPLDVFAVSTKTEELHNCSSSCDGEGETINTSSFTTAVIQVCCTFSGTVTFKSSVDGINFDAMECTSTADATTTALTATSRGQWRCNVVGFNKLRAEVSGYVSGTITVTAGLASEGAN